MRLTDFLSKVSRSPLTDPRSLGGSLAFHLLMILLASAAALGVALPSAEDERPKSLRGELDPVDNRASKDPDDGGGAPGPIGVDRLAEALTAVAPTPADQSAARPAPADALLSEILPAASTASEAVQQSLPGPQTSDPALMGGASGGGGGVGTGTGGGVGRGTGPGTEFFGARENALSFAYVIDCSGSMASFGSLDVAKRELTNSLQQLPPDAKFGVIFYNLRPTTLSDPQGRRGLMSATKANKSRLSHQLNQITPDGGTEHIPALRAAFALRPEVIFFLTDADLMTNSDVATLLSEAGGIRIQAVEFRSGPDLGSGANPLHRLATSTGGTYRYIDVTKFARSR